LRTLLKGFAAKSKRGQKIYPVNQTFIYLKENFSMERKPKSIVCIEESAKDDGFINKSAKNYRRELRVNSVGDMVDKVLRRLRGRMIQNLYIIGHGTAGYQSIGNGHQKLSPLTEELLKTNGKSLALLDGKLMLDDKAEEQLKRLKGQFAPEGKLVLGGCRVADEDKGKGLLIRISTLLDNLPVEGSEALQYPALGMEGLVIRCIGYCYYPVNVRGGCITEDDDD
jgi:hypothetical protein